MKEVATDNLVSGVRYRIHENGEQDTLGIFVGFNASHDPVFNQLNISRPDGSRFKLNPTIELSYPSDHYTFYKSAETIKEDNLRQEMIKSILDPLAPGLGKEARNFFGGRRTRKRSRRRRVMSRYRS
jgi:hypothetical protein